MISLREFVRLPFLRNDLGDPIRPTELLDRIIEGYERGGTIACCCVRQSGKSTCCSLLVLYEFLMQAHSYCVWLSGGSREQGSSVLVQKLINTLRRPAIREALKLNLNVSRSRVENLDTSATIEVLTTNEASAPGRRVSLLVCDEARAIDETLIGTIRPSLAVGGRAIYIGSPGQPQSWWWRSIFDPESQDTVINLGSKIVNPLVSPEFVEAEKRRLGKTVLGELLAQREWGGAWVALSEHPLLRPSDIAAASRDHVEPHRPGEATYTGVDLSLTKDKTSVVTIAVGEEGYLRVVHKWVWDPTTQGAVDLEQVERQVETVHRRFRPRTIKFDQYQGVLLSQRLRRRGVRVEAVPVTLDLNQRIFTALAKLLSERRLTWRKDPELERELLGLELKERSTGRFSIVDSDKRYHRDISFSLALSVDAASSRAEHGMSIQPCTRWSRPGPARLEQADGLPWHRSSRELVPAGRRITSA